MGGWYMAGKRMPRGGYPIDKLSSSQVHPDRIIYDMNWPRDEDGKPISVVKTEAVVNDGN